MLFSCDLRTHYGRGCIPSMRDPLDPVIDLFDALEGSFASGLVELFDL